MACGVVVAVVGGAVVGGLVAGAADVVDCGAVELGAGMVDEAAGSVVVVTNMVSEVIGGCVGETASSPPLHAAASAARTARVAVRRYMGRFRGGAISVRRSELRLVAVWRLERVMSMGRTPHLRSPPSVAIEEGDDGVEEVVRRERVGQVALAGEVGFDDVGGDQADLFVVRVRR